MARVHKSIRVDEVVDTQIKIIGKANAMSDAAAYEYVLRAGLIALNGKTKAEPVKEKEPQDHELTEALKAYNKLLENQISFLQDQVTAKDSQINELIATSKNLATATTQAQTLHAITETKTIDPAGDQRGGFFSRLFRRSQ